LSIATALATQLLAVFVMAEAVAKRRLMTLGRLHLLCGLLAPSARLLAAVLAGRGVKSLGNDVATDGPFGGFIEDGSGDAGSDSYSSDLSLYSGLDAFCSEQSDIATAVGDVDEVRAGKRWSS
jgi:hypothetical protein